MSDQPLSEFCVYTIVDPRRLSERAAEGGRASFTERKPWVTGRVLFRDALRKQLRMPVLLGDATDCSRLLYWGILTGIAISDDGTTFTVDRVRRLKDRRSPQELTLRSTGKTIAPGFIRPYAICRTPDFL